MKQPLRIFVTGAGGPAAVSFLRSLAQENFDFFMGDLDPNAAGLYLVPANRRFLLPPGAAPEFVPTLRKLCELFAIDLLVPTVDCELLPVADARQRFEELGTRVLLSPAEALRVSLDKLTTLRACEGMIDIPRYAVFDETFESEGWQFPVIVKPRSASGSRGVRKVETSRELDLIPRSEALLVQEYLPGDEYSVDVWSDAQGRAQIAVPRIRNKVDSGIAVTARTCHDSELQHAAIRVAEQLGTTYVANVQFRRDRNGTPRLLEVNARFPGTMPLTVASGVHMPLCSVRTALGLETTCPTDFRDTAVVRFWEDHFFAPAELQSMQNRGASPKTVAA